MKMQKETLMEYKRKMIEAENDFKNAVKAFDCKHKNKDLISRGGEDIQSLYSCHDCMQLVGIFDSTLTTEGGM